MRKALLFLLGGLPAFAAAEIGSFTGTIDILAIKDEVIQGADTSFVEIKNFNSTGSCPKGSNYVRLIIRDGNSGNRQYSMLLSAAATKSEIRVSFDSAFKNSEGYCYIRYVRYQF